MPLSTAHYLRHLAVRCARMARDCYDPPLAKELEAISVELVEKAEHLEAHFALPSAGDDDDGDSVDPEPLAIVAAHSDSV